MNHTFIKVRFPRPMMQCDPVTSRAVVEPTLKKVKVRSNVKE